MCSGIILLYLVVFGCLFFVFLSIALQYGCLLPLVTCHCLIGSFEVYLGLVVVLFAVICDTDAELPLCLCSIAFVVLLVIRWGSYFLSCSRLVALHAIILLRTPSLLRVLDVASHITYVRLFLLVFHYEIGLMNWTLLAMIWEPSRQLQIVPLGYGLIRLFMFWTYIYFLSHSFIILHSFILCTYPYPFSPLILLWACDSVGGLWTYRLAASSHVVPAYCYYGVFYSVRVRHCSSSGSLCLVRHAGFHLLGNTRTKKCYDTYIIIYLLFLCPVRRPE